MTPKTLTTTDNVKIYYEISPAKNSKGTLIFLHGIGGDLAAWQFITPALNKQGYSTIAVDLRGNGLSDHPKNLKDYRLERYAKDILEVAKTEKLGKFILIGHCYGGTVALKYATLFPQTLTGLIVMSTTYKPPFYIIGKPSRIVANFLIQSLYRLSPHPMDPGHAFYTPGKHHKDYEIGGLIRTLYHNSVRSYLLAAKDAVNLDLKEDLPKISVPTLVVCGEHDRINPLSHSRGIHRLIPGSKFRIIENTNHVLPLNNPKELIGIISAFVKDQP